MSNGRLLIAYAHPDDESFGLGAVIAAYVARGVDVYLICATNGDVGSVSPEFLNGYSSVAALRLAELGRAAQVLKLKRVYTLGYKDSGMMGSETCQDAECLWQAPQDEVVRRVVEVIREVRPQVVVTFNRYGGYGHPDHIAIQRAATQAFSLAADALYDSGQPAYRPQKLYYAAVSSWQLRLGIALLRLRGHDPRRVGRNKDIDVQAILDNIEPIHATVSIRDYYDVWDEASASHASQLGGGPSWRLPTAVRRLIAPWQGFTRVYPPPASNRKDERDLFVGVNLEEPVLTP
jgi:mycothiol S-conjugate amidase